VSFSYKKSQRSVASYKACHIGFMYMYAGLSGDIHVHTQVF
jgi:hypothetical protein